MDPNTNQSVDHEAKTLVLVLVFRDMFEESKAKKEVKMMSYNKARHKFNRVFKTSPLEKTSTQFPSAVIRNIKWLTEVTDHKEKIPLSQLEKELVSSVLYTLKELVGLEYFLLQSRNKDKIYCKLYVSEKTLKKLAADVDYQMKFQHNSDEWNKKFQKVPPYGPVWLAKSSLNKDLFVKYDEFEKENNDFGSLFTYEDKVRIVNSAIADHMDLYILKNMGLMEDMFIVHEEKPLKELRKNWARLGALFKPQPLQDIKRYFSEHIAFYFAWMDAYALFMFICAIVGLFVTISLLICTYLELDFLYFLIQCLFCIFLAIWATVFDQYWRRKEKVYAWEWGTAELEKKEVQREKFKGVYKKDETTGKMRTIPNKTLFSRLVVIISNSSIFFLIALVLVSVISIFKLKIIFREDAYWSKWMIIPGLIYAIQIAIFDLIYTKIAIWLNNLENHETMNIYNDKLAFKLFLFRFVNSYSGLFYIAFLKKYLESKGCGESGCMFELGLQLSIIFITNIILNIIELGVPWFMYKLRLGYEKIKRNRKANTRENLYLVEMESRLETYDNTIEDYMEMALQFGFVALFGSSFPVLPIIAFLEIIIEIRVDAWKLCYVTRRPDTIRSEHIGIWKSIIVTIVGVGAVINSGIVVFTSDALEGFDLKSRFIAFIILEHIFLVGMVLISYLIPDNPPVVKKGLRWSKQVIKEIHIGKIALKTEYSQWTEASNFFITPDEFRYMI